MSRKNKKNGHKKMDETNKDTKETEETKVQPEVSDDNTQPAEAEKSDAEAQPEKAEEPDELTKLQQENEKLKSDLQIVKKEYMFLMAEFDNFRKRTVKEKADLIKNGAENAMLDILPVVDDFERAIKSMDENAEIDIKVMKEGVELIYNKFMKYLEKNGVKEIDSTDKEFDTEFHDAVTTFPTDDESKKGKIIDTVQKGYTINDKVLRHAKVVVGK
ncbi:MAG: nucleotide exchange factor GrpE [Muribaculaceae bacterium]|jgi:molecular chaperone GrpE|nr:nucleotide exchange factor GrpE [Muribaculaceae bacterium]